MNSCARREIADAQIALRTRQSEQHEHEVPGRSVYVDRSKMASALLPHAQQSPRELPAFIATEA